MNIGGIPEVTGRQDLEFWRGSIARILQERAMRDSLAALIRLHDLFPEMLVIRDAAIKAQEALYRDIWRPQYSARQLLQLTRDNQLRSIQNGTQLLAVVIESIRRWECNILWGDTPQVGLLWDFQSAIGKWQPKDEAALSDMVKVHLARDLREIIVNREVETRYGYDRFDIVVDSLPKDAVGHSHQISVVIEVKGAWNRELDTAIQAQLVERYLTTSKYRHGLYFVGWYMCDQWNRDDNPRFRDHPKEGGIDHLRSKLEKQASELSTEERQASAMILNIALGSYTPPRRRTGSRQTMHPHQL